MLTRVAVFDGEGAAGKYRICFTAIHLGRSLFLNDDRGKQERDVRRKDVAILRAVKACGEPLPVEGAKPDAEGKTEMQRAEYDAEVILYGPKPGPQSLTLSQPEHDRLCALIDRVPFTSNRIEDQEDTLDWLAACEKVEG